MLFGITRPWEAELFGDTSKIVTSWIVGEFIGAEHGIGRLIIESEARGAASRMMVAVFVLMIVGIVLSALIRRLQAYLLRWQPQHQLAQ